MAEKVTKIKNYKLRIKSQTRGDFICGNLETSVGAPDVPQLRRAARSLNHRGRMSFLPKTGEQVLQPNRTKPSQDSLGQPMYPFQRGNPSQATPRRAKRPPMQTWQHRTCGLREYVEIHDNDPSAGSPTETLLTHSRVCLKWFRVL